jgi:3D (Asp-Asp-Asp) domain-containing protein
MNLRKILPLLTGSVLALAGCASPSGATHPATKTAAVPKEVPKVQRVRTTAYNCREAGGARNAIGGRLSAGAVKSAAADWSRFPVGTKFRVLQTGELYRIEDYGSALVGTGTIDLYKPTMRTMRAWGVRHVDIEIIEWGSPSRSLAILEDRTRNRHVRRMVESLRTDVRGGGASRG